MDNYEYTSCCPRQERLQLVVIISIHNDIHDIFMSVIVINPSIIVSVEAVQVVGSEAKLYANPPQTSNTN